MSQEAPKQSGAPPSAFCVLSPITLSLPHDRLSLGTCARRTADGLARPRAKRVPAPRDAAPRGQALRAGHDRFGGGVPGRARARAGACEEAALVLQAAARLHLLLQEEVGNVREEMGSERADQGKVTSSSVGGREGDCVGRKMVWSRRRT